MTTSATVFSEGVNLAYDDEGIGQAFIFQHGLGGDRKQVAEAFGEQPGTRRITLECRGHATSDYGPANALSLATFARDIERMATKLKVDAPILGGISMGAALALRLAVKGNLRPSALVLARPAWLFEPAPPNMAVYAEVGELLLSYEPEIAREIFLQGQSAGQLRREAPDNLASLVGFFERSKPREFGNLLMRIANDDPGVSREEAQRINCPVLVIGHGHDLVHPLAYARELAGVFPNATFCEITAKAVDRTRYVNEFRAALHDFLERLA
ncbi:MULTISPECIES: alpha/beta fold hydrolase [Mesorhizobium]|uniref:alpha/beta fold hydrolase n=1 Tax=Mesorhizobium TaxID=68287 RepID=UPI001314B6DA|nr:MULTISPECIES: alpha/beta hydrolase [Mesorhizobium]